MDSFTPKVTPLRQRWQADPKPDQRRLEAELLAAEVRGARISLGVLATGALRFR